MRGVKAQCMICVPQQGVIIESDKRFELTSPDLLGLSAKL